MGSLAIINKEGKETGKIDLPDQMFGGRVNTRILHQAMVMYMACQRQGTASTKVRGDVSGGGIKPYRQKGTGRARAGSIRSPLFHGGGKVFGPHPRDFSYDLPKKIKKAALRESLNAKYQASNLFCIEDLKGAFTKTKEFARFLDTLKLKGQTLALLDGCHESVMRVSRNIARFEIKNAQDVNAYDILKHKKIILTKTALNKLMDRIKA